MTETHPIGTGERLKRLDGACWKCTRCGWVGCYSAADIAEYGEPSECQDEYHESLVEIDLAEGWAALADKAAIDVRRAERALDEAKEIAADAEANLHAALSTLRKDEDERA